MAKGIIRTWRTGQANIQLRIDGHDRIQRTQGVSKKGRCARCSINQQNKDPLSVKKSEFESSKLAQSEKTQETKGTIREPPHYENYHQLETLLFWYYHVKRQNLVLLSSKNGQLSLTNVKTSHTFSIGSVMVFLYSSIQGWRHFPVSRPIQASGMKLPPIENDKIFSSDIYHRGKKCEEKKL